MLEPAHASHDEYGWVWLFARGAVQRDAPGGAAHVCERLPVAVTSTQTGDHHRSASVPCAANRCGCMPAPPYGRTIVRRCFKRTEKRQGQQQHQQHSVHCRRGQARPAISTCSGSCGSRGRGHSSGRGDGRSDRSYVRRCRAHSRSRRHSRSRCHASVRGNGRRSQSIHSSRSRRSRSHSAIGTGIIVNGSATNARRCRMLCI